MQVRFIPACAGNSSGAPRDRFQTPVHPRVCGEQPSGSAIKPGRIGSSPRVRGTGSPHCMQKSTDRFIPACAGNRPTKNAAILRNSVHPRVCGEQIENSRVTNKTSGSSPRVRGTVSWATAYKAVIRFIPACAGNRPISKSGRISRTVHPRVCGEQEVRQMNFVDQLRFIPACAGNRRLRSICF